MTVEEQLRALCDHLDAQQAPVTSEEIIGERRFESLSGGKEPDRGGRRLAVVIAIAAAIVLVIAGWFVAGGGDAVELVPADRPTSSTPPSSIDGAASNTTFVSPRNGFSVAYVNGGESNATPATQLWDGSRQADEGFDVMDTGSAAVFKGSSTAGEFLIGVAPEGCDVPRSRQEEITIDGQPGRIAECPNHIEATVVAGERLYLFTLTHDRSDARAVFDAYVATIDLTPETAVDFPDLTATFVSPTYGYTFGYIDRGGLTAATAPWDPVTQPLGDIDFDPRFDAVETGFAAYFEAASARIPAGVTIDAWVDAQVTPREAGGCGVPRSRQEEIDIDAQSGRITECQNRVEATVAAGGRLYLFILSHDRSDARAFFDAWVDTIDLTPETAAGEPVAVPHLEFGGTVTFTAPPSVPHGDGSVEIQLLGADTDGRVIMAIDPNPELCDDPPEIGDNVLPADAEEVARGILALPGIEATDPVPVRIAGTDALQIDVTSSGRNDCVGPTMWFPSKFMDDLLADYGDWRMRVYLLDHPGSALPPDSPGGLRVLAITVVASLNDFEEVHEQATPILESIAFQPR